MAEDSSDVLSIRPLLRNIRMVAKGMAYGRQEDTHELFYRLVVVWHCSLWFDVVCYGGRGVHRRVAVMGMWGTTW